MIKFFKKMSIKGKMTAVMMLVSFIAVFIASITFMFFSVYNQYNNAVSDLEGVTNILSHNCQVSIVFNLPGETEKILKGLKSKKSINEASVFLANGDLFAHYCRDNKHSRYHTYRREDGIFYTHNALQLIKSIFFADKKIAIIVIEASLIPLYWYFFQNIIFLLLMLLLSIGIIYFLSLKLQRFITDPIINLSNVARRIASEKDYSIRALKESEDELGTLIDSFNGMLSQVQIRDEELHQSELKYSNLLRGMTDGFCAFSYDGRILTCNTALQKMLGFSNNEILKLTIDKITPPNWRELELNIIHNDVLKKGFSEIYEKELICKNGDNLPVEQITYAIITEDGKTEGFWSIIRNIAQAKKIEKEKYFLEEKLRQAQKMESIGMLAGGIAHDFNNFLSPIIGYSEMILDEMKKNNENYSDIKEIFNAGNKAKDLTRQLLAFSRKQILTLKVVKLSDIIAKFEKIMMRSIHENIKMTICNSSDKNINADTTQIQQVILNLIINAQDAMPKGGNLDIKISNAILDEVYLKGHENIEPGKYVQLTVSDTGIGMNKEILSHVFDPFYTTKGYSKGTGLGLSMVFGIVKQHGGHVWIYSEPGIGTSVKVYFPLTDSIEDLDDNEEEIDLEKLKGDETIILAEDSDMVNKLITKMLKRYGYNVKPFLNPKEALSCAQQSKEVFELLVSDLIMPDLNGRELYDAMKEFKPDLKVIYMSGYSDEVIGYHDILDYNIKFLQKPISEKVLMKNIREVLDYR